MLGLAAPAAAAPAPPQTDPFYAPPADLAAKAPGTVLRSRPASLAVFGRVPQKVSAWQVLYRTTDTQGAPEATVATILEPRGATGGAPLVSYQVAEDSLGAQCAPSYQLQAGVPSDNGVEQAEILLIDGLLEHGWAVVVPDYEGPRSSYTAGVQAGRAVLDGIRAAEGFGPAGLAGADTPVGLWGYSGGALATGWASELQPGYAPELKLKATAEGGFPVDIASIAHQVNKGAFSGFYLAGTVGLSREYPELAALLAQHLTPAGRAAVAKVGTQCNATIVSSFAFRDIEKYFDVPNPLSLPAARHVLAADTLGQHRPTGPLYVYHAVHDELIPIAGVDRADATYCAEGVTVQYQRDSLSEHISLVATGAPAAFAWLEDRFAGRPAPSNCGRPATVPSTLLSPRAATTLVKYLAGLARFF